MCTHTHTHMKIRMYIYVLAADGRAAQLAAVSTAGEGESCLAIRFRAITLLFLAHCFFAIPHVVEKVAHSIVEPNSAWYHVLLPPPLL